MVLSPFSLKARSARNWTSPETPLWEEDLFNYWRAGGAFEVREVASEKAKLILTNFAQQHGLQIVERGRRGF